LRLILAIVAGFIAGSCVNMALVFIGSMLITAPAGADVTTTEGLRASIHLFGPQHYVFPFLAHSLGTLLGAWVTTLLVPGRPLWPAMVVGVAFLLGGIASTMMIPAATWFIVLDLAAYLPMALLGWKLAAGRARS
jgi:hypothetical protein